MLTSPAFDTKWIENIRSGMIKPIEESYVFSSWNTAVLYRPSCQDASYEAPVLCSISERMRPLVWSSRFLVVIITLTSLTTDLLMVKLFPPPWLNSPTRGLGLLTVEVTRSHSGVTFDRTLLDERSARQRQPYLTTQKAHKRQISMPAEEFEPSVPARERPQTDALHRAVTGTGSANILNNFV